MSKQVKHSSPKWASRFLEFYCKEEFLEEIQGDVQELFKLRVNRYGVRRARLMFAWDVLRFFKWSNIKTTKTSNSNHFIMFLNNFKIAFRVFNRQKLFSLITVLSLTIGIAGVSLIYLFIQDELSYDNFHEKKARVHRVVIDYLTPEGTVESSMAYRPLPLGPALKRDFPEVESFVRVSRQNLHVKVGQNIQEEAVVFADSSIFNVFTFPLIYGDENHALDNPKSILISQSMAEKYFGQQDVVGETFKMMLEDRFEDYLITGVVKDIPFNSSVRFDIITGYSDLPYYSYYKNSWNLSTDETYVLLRQQARLDVMNEKIAKQWEVYTPKDIEEIKNGEEPDQRYRLQPLKAVHLDTSMRAVTESSDPVYSFILGGIALVILLIACANFTTLSIARSAHRGKEIGVRKVIGANRQQLINQFWSEAILLSLVSLLISLLLVKGFLPTFNQLTDKHILFTQLFSIGNIAALLLIAVVSGLLAGVYPSLVLSGLKVIDIFRKKVRLGGGNLFTKSLITFQFVLTILLVVGTMVMIGQVNYMKNKDLGFEDDHVLAVSNDLKNTPDKLQAVKNAFRANPDVINISMASSSFTKGHLNSSFVFDGREIPYAMFRVDTEYLETLGIDLLEGRMFQKGLSTDSSAVVVNKAFMDAMGPEFKLGERVPGFNNAGLEEPRVIGVTNDYHFESLADQLKPTMLMIKGFSGFDKILVRSRTGESLNVLKELEASWYEIAPDIPFTASLLSADMESQYTAEDRWTRVIKTSAYLAISIATLGLIGLVGLSVSSRIKEIGIRKVLGAQAYHIFLIIFLQFRWLFLLALIVSIPISVYVLNLWLEGFAYHININPVVYLFTGLGMTMVIALVVVTGIIKVSFSNPADTLRVE